MCAGSWVGGCCFLLQGPHGAGGLRQGSHSTWRVPVAGAAGVGAGEGHVSAVGWSWLLWLLSALRKSLRVHPMWGCSCSHVDVFHVSPPRGREQRLAGRCPCCTRAGQVRHLPRGHSEVLGKAAFDQSSSRGKVSEPCSFWEHAAGGRFPIELCPILALLELHIRVMLKRSVRVLSC